MKVETLEKIANYFGVDICIFFDKKVSNNDTELELLRENRELRLKLADKELKSIAAEKTSPYTPKRKLKKSQ